MPIGMMAVSQTSTSSEALVGIGLIPSSNVGGAQPATSSIERRATWASTMVVSWPGIPLANLPPPRESPTAPYFERLVLAPANSYRRPYTIQAFNQQQNTLGSLHCVSRTISKPLLYDADESARHHVSFHLLVRLKDDVQDSGNGALKALSDIGGVIAFLKSGEGRNSALGMDKIE